MEKRPEKCPQTKQQQLYVQRQLLKHKGWFPLHNSHSCLFVLSDGMSQAKRSQELVSRALWLEPLKASLISRMGTCQRRKNNLLLNHRHAGFLQQLLMPVEGSLHGWQRKNSIT